MFRNTTILIAQRQPAVISRIRRILEQEQSQATLCAASTGDEALRLILLERPGLVLMGLTLDGALDGIETARRIPPQLDVALVYLGGESDEPTLERAMQTAPSGYVLSPFEPRQLLIAMRVALAHRQVAAEAAQQRERGILDGLQRIALALAETELLVRESRGPGPTAPGRSALAALSKREWEVLRALRANGRVPTIARGFHISQNTVRNHLKAIFRKLGVSSQAELLERMGSTEVETLH